MIVPAPGLLSTMTGWPRSLAISAPSVRAIRSVPPPGAKGTTRRTGFSGKAADAALQTVASTAMNAMALAQRRGGELGMVCLPVLLAEGRSLRQRFGDVWGWLVKDLGKGTRLLPPLFPPKKIP